MYYDTIDYIALLVLILILLAVAFVVYLKLMANREKIIDAVTKGVDYARDTSIVVARKVSDRDSTIDEQYFELAASELSSGQVRQGLWQKQMALATQDENLARSSYIRIRARELRDASKGK